MFRPSYWIFWFLLTFTICNAQKKFEFGDSPPADAVDAEKIYLQLTSQAFNTSEVIWFKAIVTNAFYMLPSQMSGVLHVELIDPFDKKIVDSKLLKLENGIAESFFQLHQDYPEGRYLIRAYTEWNKNFGADFVFSTYVDVFRFQNPEYKPDPIRDITITKELNGKTVTISSSIVLKELDSLHKGKAMLYFNWEDGSDSVEIKPRRKGVVTRIEHDIANNVKTLKYRLKTQNKSYSKSIVLDEDFGSLVFFPEGGALVNNVKSTLGFKYLNYEGKGAEIKGAVVDQSDNEVAIFRSNHLGMGKTFLQPENGKSYFGVIQTEKGTTYKYPIPAANSSGTVMSLFSEKHTKSIALIAQAEVSDSIFIKFYQRGKDLYLMKGLMKNGKFNYTLKNEILPNGLIGATLYNSKYEPIAERHFYNYKPEAKLSLKIDVDKGSYQLRDSVVVDIQAGNGEHPLMASLSLMAVNKEYFSKTNLSQRDIVSYFFLESDIRGEIESPSYYFEQEDHLKDLDYLMLTQGWTNYKYDRPQKPKIFQPEKGLQLLGYVRGVEKRKNKKRFKNEKFDLSLITFGTHPNVYHQEIDGTGYFNFQLEESYGDGKKFLIQPGSSNRKKAILTVNLDRRKIPEIQYEKRVVFAPADSIVENTIVQRVVRDIALDPYLLPNTIELNEVVVSDYIMTPEREKMNELHGMPDVVIDNKELIAKEKNWTSRLFNWLLFNYPKEVSVKRVGGVSSFLYASIHGAGFTYVLVDGMPVNIYNFSLIPDIPLSAVKSVEIIRNRSSANRYCSEVFNSPCIKLPPFPGILAIYTYSGKGLFGAFPKRTNLILNSTPEFSPKREFYSPTYENLDVDPQFPDLRKLIYWNPNIQTDTSGKAQVKFFNGDIGGEVLIICEGIDLTKEGVGRSQTSYQILD